MPEIHAVLLSRGVSICERSVTSLVDRYDELLATALGDSARLYKELADQGRVVLALDGLQADVGNEVLWVLRDCLSSQVLLARSLLSSTSADLAQLLREALEPLSRAAYHGPQDRQLCHGAARPSATAGGDCHAGHLVTARELSHANQQRWRELRAQLERHHRARVQRARFRRNPDHYLAVLGAAGRSADSAILEKI